MASSSNHLPPAPTSTRQATVASAAVLTESKIKRLARSHVIDNTRWQEEAWRLFDVTGELRYATAYEANAVSLSRIYAAKLPEDPSHSPQPIEDADHPANVAMARFLGGSLAQSEALARIDTQLAVAGVSYIVAYDAEDPDDTLADQPAPGQAAKSAAAARQRSWHVLSNREISHDGNRWKFRIEGQDVFKATKDALVIRVWTPHPADFWAPDSPVRSLIPVLSELEALSKHVSATVDSRLAGAGLLVLPQGMTFVSNRDDLKDDEDPFVRELIDAMTTPIANRDSAAALVPMVIKVPDDLVQSVNHITFASNLDPETHNLRTEAIRRIALGLDIPPEILLGLGDANHWSAWQIEDSSIKLHVEPKLRTICNAATTAYLRPFLKTQKVEDPHTYVVWYDTTAIRLRPNRATDARDLHEDLLINDQARRQAAGFSEDDAPTEEEFKIMLLRSMLVNQPQLAAAILPLLGIDVPPEVFLSPSERLLLGQQGQNPTPAPSSNGNGNGQVPTPPDGSIKTISPDQGISNRERPTTGDPKSRRSDTPPSGRPQVTTTTTSPD